MTALRKLLLGETRALPAAVFTLLAAGLVLRAVAPGFWDAAGGWRGRAVCRDCESGCTLC